MQEVFLKQRNFLTTRSFKFEANGIRAIVQGALASENVLVPFEYISIEPYERTSFSPLSKIALISGLVFLILSLIMYAAIEDHSKKALSAFLIYFACTIISFVLFYFQRMQLVIYGQGEKLRLVLYKNKPNKENFEEAVRKIQAAKIKYLRETYLNNKMLNIPTLNWLKSLGAVKQEEIERITNIPPMRDNP